MQITSMSASLAVATSPARPGCSVNAVTWTPPAGLPLTINANGTPVALIGSVSMGAGGDNACQGAAFVATITVSGRLG